MVGATVKISNRVLLLINNHKDISLEHQATLNDVTDCKLILLKIHDLLAEDVRAAQTLGTSQSIQLARSNHTLSLAIAPEAGALNRKAQANLVEIEDIVKKEAAVHKSKLGRLGPFERNKLGILGDDLRSIKLNINTRFLVESK